MMHCIIVHFSSSSTLECWKGMSTYVRYVRLLSSFFVLLVIEMHATRETYFNSENLCAREILTGIFPYVDIIKNTKGSLF